MHALANEGDATCGNLLDLQFRNGVLGLRHELLLSVDESIELVDDAPRLDGEPFETRPVHGELLPKRGLVGVEQVADLVDRHIE